jgi:diaminopimelate decarboxylase
MMTADKLLSQFGSPLYVYRLEQLDAAVQDLRDALPERSTLYYSAKANPHPELIRRLAARGCKTEISSIGELAATQAAGVPGNDCLYTGPAKTVSEVAAAIAAGVALFSCESLSDIRRVGTAALSAGVEVDCLLRVNGVSGGGSGLRMTGRPSQFGIGLEEMSARRSELLAVPGTRVVGLHFFPVSNSHDEASLVEEILGSIAVAASIGAPIRRLDLGGGFPAPFATPGEKSRFKILRDAVEGALDHHFDQWRHGQPEIMFESGRYLVSAAGSLACTVMEIKRSHSDEFVIVDAGVNHLGGMAGLGRLARPAATPEGVAGESTGTIAGPLCTPADVLGRNVSVGSLRPGDVITFPNVGAYGLTASLLGFLSRATPAEVVLDRDRLVSASRVELKRVPLNGATR